MIGNCYLVAFSFEAVNSITEGVTSVHDVVQQPDASQLRL